MVNALHTYFEVAKLYFQQLLCFQKFDDKFGKNC